MAKITYSTDGMICITSCPFGIEDNKGIRMVGSNSCAACEWHKKNDLGCLSVNCSHP